VRPYAVGQCYFLLMDSSFEKVYALYKHQMFRLAEVYLTAAEAHLRSGNSAQALDRINTVRSRAYNNGNGAISAGDLTLDFILDERSRELAWELMRRTDLIRYNYFTTPVIFGAGKTIAKTV